MNDDRLAATVSDWLEASDSPPADPRASRRTAVAAARGTNQARTGSIGDRHPFVSRRWNLSAAAAVVVLVISAALVFRALGTDDGQPSLVAGPSAPPPAVHWQTDVVAFAATGFSLAVEDQVFTTEGSSPAVHSDPGYDYYWTLEIEWFEHDVEQRMYWYFSSDGSDWWVNEMRTYDGHPEGAWVSAYGPFFKTPLGEAFEGDVRVELRGDGRPDDPGNRVEAVLSIDHLRLAVAPSGSSRPATEVIAERALDGWRAVRDGLFPQPTRAPATPEPMGRVVATEVGGLALTGELLPDGLVRVIDDGAGHKLEPVVSVALAPDGTLWVARHKAIFALGQPGEVKIGEGDPQGKIERIATNEDGSLTVYADGVWRLEDGEWTLIEPARRTDWYFDGDAGRASVGLPDGSVWRLPAEPDWENDEPAVGADTLELKTDDGWIPFTMEEVFPGTRAQFPNVRIRPRIVSSTSPGGGLWVSSERSLSHFDGVSWEEVSPERLADLAGDPVVVRDVELDEAGTLWVLVTGDDKEANPGAIERLLRLSDGTWESIPLGGLLPDETAFFYGLDPAHGKVYLLERDREFDYTYGDSGLVRLPAPGPHDTLATADGTVFGTARPRTEGLLMIPAGDLRPLDEAATASPRPSPS